MVPEKRMRCLISALLCLISIQAVARTEPELNWDNPGGMWPPAAIAKQKELLEGLGLQIPVENISNPASSTLQAVVSLGYCSGSFISEDGLIITNHHCAVGMLSWLSRQDMSAADGRQIDYVRDGFHAFRRSDEKSGGPTERIYITMSQKDVTAEVLAGLNDEKEPLIRGKKIEERIKALVAQAEAEEGIHAEVTSFYRDSHFLLIRQLEIKDVRLVYAPPGALGYYGGDTDNWTWPRHTADFAILRAYVGPDGKPAPYHKDNVPYHPRNILSVAKDKESWVKNNDLILVAGYPGHTNRLDTAEETRTEIEESIPWAIRKYKNLRELLGKLAENPDYEKKIRSKMFSLDNYLKNRRDALAALHASGYLEQKLQDEQEMEQWIHADCQRSHKWGQALSEMNELHRVWQKDWQSQAAETSLLTGFALNFTHLIPAAIDIVRMAEEREKADELRHPDYQERQWETWIQKQESSRNSYHRDIAVATFEWLLKQALELSDQEIPEIVHHIIDVPKAREDERQIRKTVEQLFTKTSLESVETRIDLFRNASSDDLLQSDDPIIRLALHLSPVYQARQDRSKEEKGEYLEANRRYIEALSAWKREKGQLLAPDANSTLRITFGHVGGYQRLSSQTWQSPFTSLSDLLTKHKWNDPEFAVPYEVLQQLYARNFEPYTDSSYGYIPLNFLAAVDTTGGNSGSPAMNAKGELIGLLFDGNSDALFSDWIFKSSQVRSILVDIRYVLWILDKVSGAEALLEEIGIRNQNTD